MKTSRSGRGTEPSPPLPDYVRKWGVSRCLYDDDSFLPVVNVVVSMAVMLRVSTVPVEHKSTCSSKVKIALRANF